MAHIEISPDVEDGLATMIADIIKGNLEEKPKRENDFNALNGNIYMKAEDAEVDMTLGFNKGILTVYNGKVGSPQISITTDSTTLIFNGSWGYREALDRKVENQGPDHPSGQTDPFYKTHVREVGVFDSDTFQTGCIGGIFI